MTTTTAAPTQQTSEAKTSNSAAARGRSEWRDVTAMHLAVLERDKIEARKVICRRMLAEGATTTAIMDATRKEFGFGIGAGTIQRVREGMEREAKRAARKERRSQPKTAATKPVVALVPQPAPVDEWARLPGTLDVITALVNGRVPFVFDGKSASVKGGAR